MFTLEIGAVEAAWICGLLLVSSMGLVLLGGLFWRQHLALQRSLARVGDQVSVFAEASISVAQTVEQSLIGIPAGQGATQKAKASGGRRELLQVAARRLAQNQPPLVVQQALNLSSEELKLLQVGAASAQRPLAPSQPEPQQEPQAVSGAPRAVA